MNFQRVASKIFAVFLLFFVNLISVDAQPQNNLSAYDIPAGTRIRVSMENEINSKVAAIDDTFTVTVSEPLIIREVIVLPAGTIIEGRIVETKSASVGGENGSFVVSFETIRLANGVKRQIEAVLVNPPKINSSAKFKTLAIIGAAALGGIIGFAAGQESGALVGAGIGAGASAGFVFAKKGKEIRIKTDEKFEIKLVKNVTLPAMDF